MKPDGSFLLENAAWPAFVAETGGTIRVANQAAIAFFGPPFEAESTTLSAIWAEESESADQFLGRWERSAASVVLLKFRGKGSNIVSFQTHICPSRDVQKRFLFQLWRDSGAAAESSSRAAEPKALSPDSPQAFKQKLDCALQLTRTVALDFNNALTSILGHTSLVLSKLEWDHPWRASLVEVEKAAGRAAEIAQQLAAFSRQDKEPLGLIAGNLNVLLRRAVDVFQQPRDVQITWSLQLESRLYSVRFDEARIQQAFVKVIENAVEAFPDRGHLSVTSRNLEISEPTQDRTAQLSPGSYVCVEIADDGSGMPADVLARVFEPFFTTKQGHRGLGLAWVYGIVTNHGGGVAVSSTTGQGTSVRIYLPATRTIVREAGEPLPQTAGQHTILMVDDEDLLLTMGRTILSAFGYRVLTASNGQQALDLMAKASPPVDLVIADLVMPQMSGRDLIDQIRARFPGVPVICASGYVRPGAPEENEAFLQKPFTSNELVRRVQAVLENSQDD